LSDIPKVAAIIPIAVWFLFSLSFHGWGLIWSYMPTGEVWESAGHWTYWCVRIRMLSSWVCLMLSCESGH
jgi:hypothetical protein